jgi:hypothetical protein
LAPADAVSPRRLSGDAAVLASDGHASNAFMADVDANACLTCLVSLIERDTRQVAKPEGSEQKRRV